MADGVGEAGGEGDHSGLSGGAHGKEFRAEPPTATRPLSPQALTYGTAARHEPGDRPGHGLGRLPHVGLKAFLRDAAVVCHIVVRATLPEDASLSLLDFCGLLRGIEVVGATGRLSTLVPLHILAVLTRGGPVPEAGVWRPPLSGRGGFPLALTAEDAREDCTGRALRQT